MTRKFPGSTAEYDSHVSGAGHNRNIPVEEGGGIQKGTGRLTKAGDFDQGEAGEGPEDILRLTSVIDVHLGGKRTLR